MNMGECIAFLRPRPLKDLFLTRISLKTPLKRGFRKGPVTKSTQNTILFLRRTRKARYIHQLCRKFGECIAFFQVFTAKTRYMRRFSSIYQSASMKNKRNPMETDNYPGLSRSSPGWILTIENRWFSMPGLSESIRRGKSSIFIDLSIGFNEKQKESNGNR